MASTLNVSTAGAISAPPAVDVSSAVVEAKDGGETPPRVFARRTGTPLEPSPRHDAIKKPRQPSLDLSLEDQQPANKRSNHVVTAQDILCINFVFESHDTVVTSPPKRRASTASDAMTTPELTQAVRRKSISPTLKTAIRMAAASMRYRIDNAETPALVACGV